LEEYEEAGGRREGAFKRIIKGKKKRRRRTGRLEDYRNEGREE